MSTFYEQKKESNKRHFAKLDQIIIRVPKGDKDKYKEKASREGLSLNAYIVRALSDRSRLKEAQEYMCIYRETGDKSYISKAIQVIEDEQRNNDRGNEKPGI